MPVLLETDPVCFARDENNDLIIPLRIVRGLEAIMVLVRTALLLWRDEYYLNRDIGMPWIETEDGVVPERDAILGQAYEPAKVLRAVRAELLPIPGVRDIAEFRSSFEDPADGERTMTVSLVVRTQFGDSDPLTVTVGA